MILFVFFRNKGRRQGSHALEDLIAGVNELVDAIDGTKDNTSRLHVIFFFIHLDFTFPRYAIENFLLVIV
jgi:hypothetical protein